MKTAFDNKMKNIRYPKEICPKSQEKSQNYNLFMVSNSAHVKIHMSI